MSNYSLSAEVAGRVPTVNITTNNNRKKRYNKETSKPIYYLNSGQEFQIELFNPTTNIVKANISLNGKLINGGGLVLRPGERVFLDRYFESSNKFKFETYKVGNNATAKRAIINNGSVKVEFYKEQQINWCTGSTITISEPWYDGPCWTDASGTGIYYSASGTCSDIGSVTTDSVGCASTLTSNVNVDNLKAFNSAPKKSKIETGRVGKGGTSNQKFDYVHYDFEYSPFYTVEYKLLPISQRQTTTQTLNIVRYCTECGATIKKTFRFCAQCGCKC